MYIIILNLKEIGLKKKLSISMIYLLKRGRKRDESIYLHVYFSGFPLSVCIRTSDFPFIVSMGLITCTSRVLSNSTCSNFQVQRLPIKHVSYNDRIIRTFCFINQILDFLLYIKYRLRGRETGGVTFSASYVYTCMFNVYHITI